MAIDWSLLGPPVDIGAKFREGYEHGQALRKKQQTEAALAAFAKDPTNPNVQGALAGLSPEFATYFAKKKLDTAEEQAKRTRIGNYVVDGDFAGGAAKAAQAGDVDIAETLLKLDKPQKDRLQNMYKAAAPIAYQALKLPYEQRKAYIDSVRPELKANGWTDEQIDGFDPTDKGLTGVVHSQMTLEKAMERDTVTYKPLAVGDINIPYDASGRPMVKLDANGRPIGTVPGGVTPTAAGSSGDMQSYDDPAYSALEAPLEQELGLPQGLMARIRTKGERSNADQVSPAGARTVYQITPPTRDLFLKKYGVDAYASPKDAARVAALHLKESIERGEDPVRGYIGGPDKRKWGPQTQAYAERVGPAVSEDAATIRAHAKAAIAAGADPALVKERAASMGVTL